jgi:hypothetical protein
MSKFKIGDRVIATSKANDTYSITREGWTGVVTDVDGRMFSAKGSSRSGKHLTEFDELFEECFELVGALNKKASYSHGIKKVIFNAPATIVLWTDNTKTVVKCGKNDTYDAEKGLAMCIAKKYLGNEGNYNNVFKEWLPEPEEVSEKSVKELLDEAVAGMFEPFGGDVK